MLFCSLKRQQQKQWTRLYCLYLHLVNSTLLKGPSVIQRTKLGWLETAWQGLVVYPASGEILGSPKSYWFWRCFLSLAPFPAMPTASCLPLLAESLGSSHPPTAFWRCISSLHVGWGKQVQAAWASSKAQGQVWPVRLQKLSVLPDLWSQPMKLAISHGYFGFSSDIETLRSKEWV